MTDLAEVREYFAGNPWVTDIIDAHLKEDAERERLQKALPSYYEQQAKRMEAELARLREALEKIANYGNAVAGAQHTNVSWGRQQMADEARNALKETT